MVFEHAFWGVAVFSMWFFRGIEGVYAHVLHNVFETYHSSNPDHPPMAINHSLQSKLETSWMYQMVVSKFPKYQIIINLRL